MNRRTLKKLNSVLKAKKASTFLSIYANAVSKYYRAQPELRRWMKGIKVRPMKRFMVEATVPCFQPSFDYKVSYDAIDVADLKEIGIE